MDKLNWRNNKYQLYAPESYWKISYEEHTSICNGCGAANSKIDMIPDTIYFVNISEACNIHDYMYYIGETINDKKNADMIFLENLLTITNTESSNGFMKWLRRRRAIKYYLAVKYFGNSAYWTGKNRV